MSIVARVDEQPWPQPDLTIDGRDPLTRLVMGCGSLKHDLATRGATLQRALDLGIRRFDTSIYYGHGLSQTVLGQTLGRQRDEVFVATKLGHFDRRFPGADALYQNRDALRAQIHECFRALRRPPDLLQVHEADQRVWWPGTAPGGLLLDPGESGDYAAAPILSVLREARDQGLCRAIGITGNHPASLATVLQDVEVDTVLVAYHYDPIFRSAGERLMPLAAARGVTVLLASIFQSGAYHRPPEESRRLTRDPRVVERFAAFQALGREAGLGITEMVVRFMVSAAPTARIVLGASRPEQVEKCVAAWLAGPLPDDLQAAVDALALAGGESLR